jgi:hypothetical protein
VPYISKERRDLMQDQKFDGESVTMHNAGELNYELTVKIIDYLVQNGLCYQTINDIVGALEGAKVEFCRRVVAPYENLKAKQNGDLYSRPMVSQGPGAARAKLPN